MPDKLMVPPKDSLVPEDIHYAKQWGRLAREAKIVPLELNEYQAAAIVQTGRELGLQPLQSLRNMSFIKGRICMSVQLQLALASAKGVTRPHDWLKESPGKCTVTLERGKERVTCEYTLEDARKAGLLQKSRSGEPTNWEKYEKQMLRWRAIGDALRLIASDLVMGLLSPEEAASIDAVQEPAREEVPFPEPEGVREEAVQETLPDVVVAERRKEVVPEPGKKPVPDVRTEPVVSKQPRSSRFRFLDAMGEMKREVGDERYYAVLKSFGFEHANEIQERDTMVMVFQTLKHELQSQKEMEEALGLLEGEGR